MNGALRRQLDALLFMLRESPLLRRANRRSDPRACGLSDMVRSGWCNAADGELFTGFAVGPDDTVLDVGCGDGLAVMFCAQRGAHVSYCDVDAGKLASLGQRLAARGLSRSDGRVVEGDRLPFEDGSMSHVIATEVLEHVEDPRALLRELVRLGRPGARYLISIPDASAEHFQQPFAHPSYFAPPNHVRILTSGQLDALLEECGIAVDGRGQWGFYWFMWMNFFWASQQGSSDVAIIDQINPPYHPLLESWAETWTRFLELPGSGEMQRAFNAMMPKSSVVVGRRK